MKLMSTSKLNEDNKPGGVVPGTFVIDLKWKIRQKNAAHSDKETLEKYIAELFEKD